MVDKRYSVGRDRVALAIRCWGRGHPVVVMEGGSGEGGLGRWERNPVTEQLIARTQVCAYDRAGVGRSAPAPNHARGLDDVVGDLHALLEAAGVTPPYVMAGVSGGGFYAFHYAGRFPTEVSGLALIDTPPGQARMSAQDLKELAWNSAVNAEHVDYVAVEHQMAVARLPIPPVPVTVVTGRFGQSADDPESQKVWLTGSTSPQQVILETGHDVDRGDPAGLARAILHVLKAG